MTIELAPIYEPQIERLTEIVRMGLVILVIIVAIACILAAIAASLPGEDEEAANGH